MTEQLEYDKINQLLHFMKAERFARTFTDLTRDQRKWCPFQHGKRIDRTCYLLNPSVQNLLVWIRKYVTCCEFLDANRYVVEKMKALSVKLQHPEMLGDYKSYHDAIGSFKSLVEFVEPEMGTRIDGMTCQESIRMDEALVCFENYSFYASVIMAVSAIESRIVELIKQRNKALYNSVFRKFTLGQLVQVFDDNMYKEAKYAGIKKLLPAKHKPLIVLLNQYRVFSAHPKEEVITAQIAEAVLHLSFCFMIDRTTSPYQKKELICSSPQQIDASDSQPAQRLENA